ncbi:hypothetical protein [Streptomyces sp. NPDC093600]|uniref:hypothetical protein n=1 Tax=Streptomyces sp. NPDC093600 TaxID=3366047 RepID=UPI003830A8CA
MCHPAWARARIEAQRLDDLARLRRDRDREGDRDRIDREYARSLDVEALAGGANLPAERQPISFGEAPVRG